MQMVTSGRVLICSAPVSAAAEFRQPLEQIGLDVHFHHIHGDILEQAGDFALFVVDGTNEAHHALRCCRQIQELLVDQYTPILFVARENDLEIRVAGLQHGADMILVCPFEPAELLAQTHSLLRGKHRHDRLLEKTTEVNRINNRLQAAYKQIDQELEIAQRIQESFLPQQLPQLPSVKFAVQYRPCSHVGGDFYDVFRLDENHVGFYVADAMGHGVPASLLTIFVKTGVRGKEIDGKSYRLVPPDEVLQRLNQDLIEQALSDHPFITMAYCLFNFQEGTIQFSRAGHPYPLYLPRTGEPSFWKMEGSLLGVFDITYAVQSHQLAPGDKLVLYTDGTDAASFQDHAVGVPSVLEAARHYRNLPIDQLLEQLREELFHQTDQSDDLTLLGVEILG